MKGKRLTLAQREQLCIELESGSKVTSVGLKFNISRAYASRIYRKVRGVSLQYFREVESIVQEFHATVEPFSQDLVMIVIE